MAKDYRYLRKPSNLKDIVQNRQEKRKKKEKKKSKGKQRQRREQKKT